MSNNMIKPSVPYYELFFLCLSSQISVTSCQRVELNELEVEVDFPHTNGKQGITSVVSEPSDVSSSVYVTTVPFL